MVLGFEGIPMLRYGQFVIPEDLNRQLGMGMGSWGWPIFA